MDNDVLLNHIEDIVKKDTLRNKNLKDLEISIKKELEISKMDLVDKFQSEITEMKASHELLLIEKENHAKELISLKDKEILQLENRIEEIFKQSQEKFSTREKQLIDQIKDQENKWSQKISDINKLNNENMKGLNDKFELEKVSIDLISKAKIDAKEDHYKKLFERKVSHILTFSHSSFL